MKQIKYIATAIICALLVSCMGDNYEVPDLKENPYGNKALIEKNIKTIEQIKEMYSNAIASNSPTEITEDIQIKAYVSGNDMGGNLYQTLVLQDPTGGILISIGQEGLYGYLPIGQEVLISLKGFYIGGYHNQPQIGSKYYNTKYSDYQIGRLNSKTWATHYKTLGKQEAHKIVPEEFDKSKIKDKTYLKKNCGKLMVIKDIELKSANGKAVFAPNDRSKKVFGNGVNQEVKEFNEKVLVVRTSIFAHFSKMIMPKGKLNLTGIFTRYNDTWQITLRTADDIQPITAK